MINLWRIGLVFGLAFSIYFVRYPRSALACTQPVGGHPSSTAAERTNKADVVFEATVISQDSDYNYSVTVDAIRYFKDEGGKTLQLGPYGTSALCLQEASMGERYIFYAKSNADGQLWASYIGTHGLDKPNAEIEAEIIATVGQQPTLPIGQIFWVYLPLIVKTDEL